MSGRSRVSRVSRVGQMMFDKHIGGSGNLKNNKRKSLVGLPLSVLVRRLIVQASKRSSLAHSLIKTDQTLFADETSTMEVRYN